MFRKVVDAYALIELTFLRVQTSIGLNLYSHAMLLTLD